MKAIFLDRDGVINKDLHRYVTKWEDFEFLPGSLEAIKKLTNVGYNIFIISNQGGISWGLMSELDLKLITDKMLEQIKKNCGDIKNIYYCPHKTEDNCSCRKPKTGLFDLAVKENNIEVKRTYFIGDDLRDVQVSKAIGCKSILVFSGKVTADELRRWDIKPDYTAKNLLEAVNKIVLK